MVGPKSPKIDLLAGRSPEFKIGNRDYLETLKVGGGGKRSIPSTLGMGFWWDVFGWKKKNVKMCCVFKLRTRLWFQIFFLFTPIWGKLPF